MKRWKNIVIQTKESHKKNRSLVITFKFRQSITCNHVGFLSEKTIQVYCTIADKLNVFYQNEQNKQIDPISWITEQFIFLGIEFKQQDRTIEFDNNRWLTKINDHLKDKGLKKEFFPPCTFVFTSRPLF